MTSCNTISQRLNTTQATQLCDRVLTPCTGAIYIWIFQTSKVYQPFQSENWYIGEYERHPEMTFQVKHKTNKVRKEMCQVENKISRPGREDEKVKK